MNEIEKMGNLYNLSMFPADDTWLPPEAIDIIEKIDSLEIIFKEKSRYHYLTSSTLQPEERVFKIIFSCVDGKWNKSEKIYGKIIPTQKEQYVFDNFTIVKSEKTTKHLQLSVDTTKCGKKVTNNNLVIDVNKCTCKKCVSDNH